MHTETLGEFRYNKTNLDEAIACRFWRDRLEALEAYPT